MQNMNRDKVGGFSCPVCGGFIPTSMEELVTSSSRLPGLQFAIDY